MHLIVLSGPTASGKTRLAIQLAQHYRTVVVSADSRQFYREMSVGTAKPTAEEQAAAPHYFIGSHSVEAPYSVGQYETEALDLLSRLAEAYEVAILTGGSGLYLKAVCEGLDTFPEVPDAVRQAVEADWEQQGLPYLQAELRRSDPDYYAEVDLSNPHRLIRALSVIRSSRQPFSSFRQRASARRPFTPIYLQLQWPRAELYDRINRRAGLMLEQGLLEEARALFPQRHLSALQTVGYQELFAYFEGRIDLEEAIRLIKRNSRRYAKRQLTWFRRDGYWKLLQAWETETAIRYIELCRRQPLRWQTGKRPGTTGQSLQLWQGEQRIGQLERYPHQAESFNRVMQVPGPEYAWAWWHQLQLLEVDSERAFAQLPAGVAGPGWPPLAPGSLPGWAARHLDPARGPLLRVPPPNPGTTIGAPVRL